MRKAACHIQPAIASYRLHLDSGANMSLTNDETKLINFRYIKRHAIAGVADGSPALYATGVGYLPWRSEDNKTLLVKCFYSHQAAETVISPNDVVLNHISDYSGWTQHGNVDDGQGYIAFHHRNSNNTTKFHLTEHNGLWYNHVLGFTDTPTCRLLEDPAFESTATMRRMTPLATFALLHDRTGHPNDDTTKELWKHLEDCPKVKRNPFWKCPSCMKDKAKHRPFNQVAGGNEPITKTNRMQPDDTKEPPPIGPQTDTNDPYDELLPEDTDLQPGQMFQMDFGFVRGTGFSTTDEDGRRITSIDGMNSYLLIIDRKTRRLWVFLTKSKTPPLTIVKDFLEQNGSRTATHRIIRTDQGGELWKSEAFQQLARECKYVLEPTGAGAPQQNGLAERPNQTLGNMMRCLLSTANLPPEYWSWALIHAVYLKNRLPHKAIKCTPYYAWTGRKPSAKLLRIFGCPVVVKNPGKKQAKLDHHTSSGIFLGYTATDHNIYYRDSKTKRIKIATHVQFDEAGFTLPRSEISSTILALQELGMPEMPKQPECLEPTEEISDMALSTNQTAKVELLSPNGHLPEQVTTDSAGYDVYSADTVIIPAGEARLIKTDMTFIPPEGTYGQLLSRSGLSVKHGINVTAGTIDPDFRGNVMVNLRNTSNDHFTVKQGDRIAQLIFYYIAQPKIEQQGDLNNTEHSNKGFGSTGISQTIVRNLQNNDVSNVMDPVTSPAQNQTIGDICDSIIREDGKKPYDIWLSDDID